MTTEADRRERRRHDRVAWTTRVRVSTIDPEIDGGTGRPFFRACEEECTNLSRGGALVRTHEAFSPGRRVLVELGLPGGHPFEAIGRVAWSRPETDADAAWGLGVEFLGAAPEHLAKLERFLARGAAGAPPPRS